MSSTSEPHRRSRLAPILVGLLMVVGLTAWVSFSLLGREQAATPTVAPDELGVVSAEVARETLADGAVAVDVRTPEEFRAGHLQDARNIDLSGDDFDDQVSTLDPSATYVVYCATGNRAAQAIERMEELGFERLLNGGGYDDLKGSAARR